MMFVIARLAFSAFDVARFQVCGLCDLRVSGMRICGFAFASILLSLKYGQLW